MPSEPLIPDVFATIRKDLEIRNTELKAALEAAREATRIQLEETFPAIFSAHPKLEKITWKQGTSGFCDGDPCYFVVDEARIEFAGKEYNSTPTCKQDHPEWSWATECDDNDREAALLINSIDDIMLQLSSSALEQIYGDPVEVVVTKDGVEADHCYYE